MMLQAPGDGSSPHFARSQLLDLWPAGTVADERVSGQTGSRNLKIESP